jgi:hypothetical protein
MLAAVWALLIASKDAGQGLIAHVSEAGDVALTDAIEPD